jgi:hypothetical protein
MSSKRRSISWETYLPDFVMGLRLGESASRLVIRLNAKFDLGLTKNNIISAMREKAGLMNHDGPLIRLLHSHHPREAKDLIGRFRDKGKGREARLPSGTVISVAPRFVPAWRRKLTPLQDEVLRELSAEPSTRLTFRCTLIIPDPVTEMERQCGRLGPEPFCRLHRREGHRWIVEELANRVRRVA